MAFISLSSKDDNRIRRGSVVKTSPPRLMAASAHLKTQTHPHYTGSKTRKRRETTISASATAAADPPTPHVAAAADGAWCCATSKPHTSSTNPTPQRRPTTHSQSPPPPPPPPPPPQQPVVLADLDALSPYPAASTSRASPGWTSPAMDASPSNAVGFAAYPPYPPGYSKFNTALNAGLLNPMSPPPLDKSRSSPTLFDMMANEQDYHPRANQIPALPPPAAASMPPGRSAQDRQLLLQERVAEILGGCSPGSQFNDPDSGDVRLTLSSRDGLSVSMNVHRQILVAHSRFFAAKLSDRWSKQQRSLPHLVEISDCDDVEIYVETLRLMYCKDLRRRLMKEDVSKVLGILKVSAAIVFDAGVLSCLEYLEAAPWAEEEEEKVASLLSQLHLESSGAGEVLKRVSLEVAPSSMEEANRYADDEILVRLLQVVLEGKDEKARREMKGLVSKMLRENSASHGSGPGGDLSKESLYSACDGCLRLLRHHFLQCAAASGPDLAEASQIARQADNLHWILDILIDRQIADEFLRTWAGQAELSAAHPRVPAIHRYEVSRVTSRLFVGIGKGQILVSKEARCLLLRTWLEPFYEDFGWMRRACKGLDRHLIEDGLGNTILTLPLAMQQEILLVWFDRFLNSGDDCPNIQRGFEVWWRRAFWRRNGEPERPPQLRIAAACENPC